MTETNYFHGDPALCKAYRDAWKEKQKRLEQLANWSAWLMGGYVYQVMVRTAPAFNSLKPRQPSNYLEKPLEWSDKKESPKDDSLFEYMTSFMKRHNKNGRQT